MTMTRFWFVAGFTLIAAVVCMLVNNAQFRIIQNLLIFLKETVKKSLISNGEPNKARIVTVDEVPKLEGWFDESQNYGLINMLGLLSAVCLLVSGGIYHVWSYIIVVPNVMFLASNIFFLPRAVKRLSKAVDINNSYVLLIQAFEKAQEIKTNDTGNTSSS